jgi:hypothetical protein
MLAKQNLVIKEDNKMTNEQKLNNIEYVETLSSLTGISRQAYDIAGLLLKNGDLDKEEVQEAIRHANAGGNLAIEAATHWIAIDCKKSALRSDNPTADMRESKILKIEVDKIKYLKADAIIKRKEVEQLYGKHAAKYYNVYAVLPMVVYTTVVNTYIKLISELDKPC